MLNVVEAIDGPIHLNLCVPGASGCERSLACAVHPVWVEAREALIKVLGRATMDRLARKRRTVQGASTSELVPWAVLQVKSNTTRTTTQEREVCRRNANGSYVAHDYRQLLQHNPVDAR